MYEYKNLILPSDSRAQEDELNDFATRGWELVQIIPPQYRIGFPRAYLRRKNHE